MKVLHITYWFPNKRNSFEGLWIKRHIDGLSKYAAQKTWHLEVQPAKSAEFFRSITADVMQCIIRVPLQNWFLIELINFVALSYLLFVKRIHRNFDVINFHIAYPQLTYWFLLKKFIKKKVIITEHWSAYHFSFGLQDKKKLYRIKNIFRHGIPVIAVSNALLNDIRLFSGNANFDGYVVPNAVDTSLFNWSGVNKAQQTFFMLSYWKAPKNPLIIIEAFSELCKNRTDVHLRIGGYGPQWEKMKNRVIQLSSQSNITFLGPLSANEIAMEMNKAAAFLHCSDYETFSVVCAESLCCGTPVIASAVGGIPEFIDKNNGILCHQNTPELWLNALNDFFKLRFDGAGISKKAAMKFSVAEVSSSYYNILRKIVHDTSK